MRWTSALAIYILFWAFTVFVVCEPAYDTCHLLRLSELDNPLR